MLQIRLADADRERLGVQVEWLDADATDVSMRETVAMQTLVDEDGRVVFLGPDAWREAIAGDPVVDDAGQQVLVEGTDRPKRKPGRLYPWAILVLGWLALRRAGLDVELSTLDFSYDGADLRAKPEDEPGKDDGSTPEPTTDS